jgi:hypothetical protein
VCQGTDDVSWHAEAEVAHDLKQVIIKMRAQPNCTKVRAPLCRKQRLEPLLPARNLWI